jgi:hypothetical protein
MGGTQRPARANTTNSERTAIVDKRPERARRVLGFQFCQLLLS